MMRIITGSARGTKLQAPEGNRTRPTSERAKQAIYNILQFEITGRRVLDLFAGSGQLGLEALSRGASSAVFSDMDAEACRAITWNIERTHMKERCRLIRADYKETLRTLSGSDPFDLIFLDPPYAADLVDDALTRLQRAKLIADGAYIVCEGEGKEPYVADGLTLHRFSGYGKINITILKK